MLKKIIAKKTKIFLIYFMLKNFAGISDVMFDQHQNLRLIDFGYTQPLFKPDQLQNDIRQTLTTLYSSLGDSIFCSEELEKLNPVIRNVMMNTDSLLSHLKPEDRLPFVSAVLIAYQSNPLLTEDDIHQLMLDLPRIQRLNSDFKIDQKIMKMSEIEVIKILTKMREILTNDQQVINKQIKKCQNSIQIKDLPLLLQKSEIINTALSLTRMDTLHSPQHILFHLRKHLQASSIILNQVPTTLREGKGLIASIKRKFHPRVSSPTQIDAKIEASIRSDYQKYRRSLKEIKDESDEQLERHKPKP